MIASIQNRLARLSRTSTLAIGLAAAAVLVTGTLGLAHAANTTNCAKGKTAVQSSTSDGGAASRAVDGNKDGVFFNFSVTSTAAEVNPWWSVDLGIAQLISHVTLYNRIDCCGDRLNSFVVSISTDNTNWTTCYTNKAIVGTNTDVACVGKARYVKISLAGSTAQTLSLAEVMIF